jgi:hypothetical protein
MNESTQGELVAPLHRAQVVRLALLYTLMTVPLLVGLIIGIINLYIPLLIACAVFGTASGLLAYHHLRDLTAEPVMTEGEVTKKWTKGNMLFFFLHGYYIAVQGNIYSVRQIEYMSLLEHDLVRVHHFPYSLTVGHLERYDEVEKRYVPADEYGASAF